MAAAEPRGKESAIVLCVMLYATASASEEEFNKSRKDKRKQRMAKVLILALVPSASSDLLSVH